MSETSIVWHPPETTPGYPLGAWREHVRTTVSVEEHRPVAIGAGGSVEFEVDHVDREVELPGRLMVQVATCPEHPRHGGAAFEPYEGDLADYNPRRDAQPGEDLHVPLDQADAEYADQRAVDRANRARVRRELEEQLNAETPLPPEQQAHIRRLLEDFA